MKNFDRIVEISPEDRKESSVLDEEKAEDITEKVETVTDMHEESVEIEDGVAIPIHTIYDLPQESIQQGAVDIDEERQLIQRIKSNEDKPKVRSLSKMSYLGRFLQVVVIFLGTFLALLAVAGSGYMDSYIISFKPVHILSGVLDYVK